MFNVYLTLFIFRQTLFFLCSTINRLYLQKFKFHIMEKKRLNRIKVMLAEKEKTNRWLSEQIDRHEFTVSKWCSNTQQPDIETLYKIAAALGVDVCDLLVRESSDKEKVV
jgi:putative transcriptional regulator